MYMHNVYMNIYINIWIMKTPLNSVSTGCCIPHKVLNEYNFQLISILLLLYSLRCDVVVIVILIVFFYNYYTFNRIKPRLSVVVSQARI